MKYDKKKTTKPTRIPRYKIKKSDLKKALKDKAGLISYVAQALNISRDCVYESIKRYKLEGDLEQARESTLDLAESQLFNALRDGNLPAVFFYLKTIGRKRGYVEKIEQEHMGEILIRLDNDDDREGTRPKTGSDTPTPKST